MKIQQEDVSQTELTQKKKKQKVKKPKEPRDIRYVFRKVLKEINLPTLKKPWMAQKAFKLITTPEDLQAWVDSVLSDTSRHMDIGGVLTPVVALDTEVTGLDTRILVDRVQKPDGSWELTHEVNIELAGICLSSDGTDGIYIPTTHEKQDQALQIPAQNIDREACAAILQQLFDKAHLVFYNAKYDREVLRLTMGINFRPYPHFEDVQVLAYINDPKADLGDKGKYTGSSGGLKALSKNVLGIEQIELEELAKVKCDFCPVTQSPFCHCTPEERKIHKHTLKNQYVPFPWVPTDIALWYAAGDAICTWLLWQKMYKLARGRRLVHRIDHELVESITWIERQRWFVDTQRLARTVKGHQKKIGEMREQLRVLALAAGIEENKQDDGTVLEDDKFNPGSTMQLQQLFFKIKGYTVTRFTSTGNPSCDAEALEDLYKEHPEDEFLKTILAYRDYMALHPDNLRYDPRDKSARIYLKQNVVAGGRLAAAGGEFEVDGGFGLNPQGIKKVKGYLMWKVQGNVLDPDPEEIANDGIETYEEADLHPSCFKEVEKEVVIGYKDEEGELPDPIVIALTAEEREVANRLGKIRNDKSEADGRKADWYDKKGGGTVENHQDGVAAEMCHIRVLGYSLDNFEEEYFRIDTFKQADWGKNSEVRGTKMQDRAGKVKDNDVDSRVVIFYRKISDQKFKLLGWLTAGEGKKIGKKEDPGGRGKPAYFLNDHQLHPIDTLPADCGTPHVEVKRSSTAVPITEKRKVRKVAPGIVNNHIGKYMGYAICLVPKCTTCADKYGVLIPDTKMDANEVINLRVLFHAPPGWTLFSVDYSNIEMRCLSGDTNLLIKSKGFVPLRNNLGSQILLNGKGEWVEGEVRSFGTQRLRRVVIGHNRVNRYVYATPEHRWILTDGRSKTTDELEHGDEIPFISRKRANTYDCPDYLLGVRHGIIYGDGSRALSGRRGHGGTKDGVIAIRRQRGYKIRLCGEDKHLLVPYFKGYKVTYLENFGGDAVVYLYDEFTATHDLKQLPDKDETEAYLVGFLRGWLAADGHAGTSGVSLCCGVEEEEWVKEVMPQFGFYFLGSSEMKKRSKGLAFFRPTMVDADFLLPHKLKGFRDHYFELHETVRRVEPTDREEEVFCAVVPGTHDFVIENGLLTGNCAANVSGEPEFINEFLVGKGDFHSLTASKVSPEFTDPNTPKELKKSFRDLAKIINFALLYGGTAFTIFENMKKKQPDIKWEEALDMVAKYWAGVPVFFEFCQMKQNIAKNEMLCKTATGRVINFESAMEAQHIRKPEEEEVSNYWNYRDLMKKSEAAKKQDDPEKAATYRAMADRLWKDSDTGVRNVMDYNKFMGKIQRVSVNVPLQGLAGDFMRMALNRIRKWVESDPLIQAVFHLHCSVHDEIDFIVKNEYVPFILPRITRLMKLRKLHEKMGWKVGIEADAEYGRSWDVEHHVTGDDDHKAAAWTEIKEVSNYIPEGWDVDTIKGLLRAMATGEEARINKVKAYLEENMHPRAFAAAKTLFDAKDDKGRKKALIAAIQLDEFWRIDSVPDDEEDKLEKLEDYERNNELTPENRDPLTPEFGFLGAVPLTANVKRPTVEILGEPVDVADVDIVVSTDSITVSAPEPEQLVLNLGTTVLNLSTEETDPEEAVIESDTGCEDADCEDCRERDEEIPEPVAAEPEPEQPKPAVESVFVDTPVVRPKKVVEQVAVVVPVTIPDDGLPTYEIVDLDELASVKLKARLGRGAQSIRILYRGKFTTLVNKAMNDIPSEFVKAVHGISPILKS